MSENPYERLTVSVRWNPAQLLRSYTRLSVPFEPTGNKDQSRV